MTFRRVFQQDPGAATFLNVASTNIVDTAPPPLPLGAGTGTVICVAEFDRGPIKVPTEVFSPTERVQLFGGLGFTVLGALHRGPVAQQSGGNEPWNGNGFIALANKQFNRLIIQRVDNSAGEVSFSRLACLIGGAGPFAANDADTAQFILDGGPTTATATLDATTAFFQASGAVYPLVSPGGKKLIFEYDDQDAMTVTLQDTDTLLADVIARINARFGATIASDVGGQLRLDSIRAGSRARFKIVGGDGLADVGLPTAVVNDVWTITVTADTAITTEVRVSKIVNGVATDFDTAAFLGPVGSVTLKRNKLLSDPTTDPPQLAELGVPGFSFAAAGAADIVITGDDNEILTAITALQGGGELTIANTTPGVALEVFGTGNVGDSQNFSVEEAANILDAVSGISSDVTVDGFLRVCNETTPGTGTIQGDILSGALLAALGFDTSTIADAANGADVVIPAGTRVQDSTSVGTVWVTLSDITTGTGGGPYTAKVRPYDDTDVAVASGAGDVTLVLDNLPDGFSVTNASAITRLTAAQLDARYITAIQETKVDAPPAKDANFIFSARSSVAINDALRINAREATAEGLAGRKAITRPRLAVTRDAAVAQADGSRDERIQFVFPGLSTAIQEIRETGVAGGIGFSDDGVIDVGGDSFLAAFRSIILPEQSAGIDPETTNFGPFQAIGLESAYDPGVEGSTKLNVNDYIRFKREGITAPKADRPNAISFVDDVTTVFTEQPLTDPRRAANRRAFADFINDSLFGIAKPFEKQIITAALRRLLRQQQEQFLIELQAPNQPRASRLNAFSVEDVTNAAIPNLMRYIVRVQMYATADAIVFETIVGPTVQTQVTEAA